MFVIISRYLKPVEEVDVHYEAHAAWLAGHYASGRILGSGRRVPPVGGLILARGESRREIEELLEHDPFVLNSCARYEVYEFAPNPLPRRSQELEAFLSRPLRRGKTAATA
jgi:uncharacterized protein YciI